MNRTVRVLSVLAGSVFLAGVIGISTASGQTVLTLVLPAESQKIKLIGL